MFPILHRHDDRLSARRRRAGRCPLVEDLEGRRLLSGSNIHHHPDAIPEVLTVRNTGGTGGGSGKVAFLAQGNTVRFYE